MVESGAAARIESREQFEQWLKKQPSEEGRRIAVLLAARAALRVLPAVATEVALSGEREHIGQFIAFAFAAFRASAVAWVVGQYPEKADELRYVAGLAQSGADAVVDNRIHALRPYASDYGDYAFAVFAASRAAAIAAGRNERHAVTDAVGYALHADAYASVSEDVDFDVYNSVPRDTAGLAHKGTWRAFGDDVALISVGGCRRLLGAALWRNDNGPAWCAKFWRALRAALPADENWQVWIDWYEDRLDGRSRGEAHELVFASVPEAEWDKGPAAANAWIKAHLPKRRELPRPLADVPSAFTFGWNASARISIFAGAQNAAAFPFAPNAGDHVSALDASRRLVERLLADLKTRRINCTRLDYQQALERYAADLPTTPGSGNLMLADAEARMLRDLFAAEVDILSPAFAARLKIILQQHIALRAFYPEVARFYDAVQSGHLERPLPEDAVAGVGRTIAANTPRYFEPEVSDGLRQVARDAPQVTLSPDDVAGHGGATIQPPPDPLGQLEPAKSRSFSVASAINSLWKTFLKGKDVPEAIEGWRDVADKLGENVGPVLDWLKDFLPKG